MHIKTDKKVIDGEIDEKINQLTNYVENLREEIEFRLNNLSQKIEGIYDVLRKM